MQDADRKSGLVLTRKVNEEIIIQTPEGVIRVHVARINGNRVRLRFDAPRGIKIDRAECTDSEEVQES